MLKSCKNTKLEVRPGGFHGGNPKPPVFWVAPSILGGGVSTSLRIASQIDSIQIYTNCLQGPMIFVVGKKKTCRSFLTPRCCRDWLPKWLFVGLDFQILSFCSRPQSNSKPEVDGLLTEEQVFNTGTVCMCFLRRVSWICKF